MFMRHRRAYIPDVRTAVNHHAPWPGTVPGLITDPEAPAVWGIAKRKAKHGRRDWFVWRDRTGACYAAPVSGASVKAAMLAGGTQGRFTRLAAGTATPFVWNWRLGMVTLAQARTGVL